MTELFDDEPNVSDILNKDTVAFIHKLVKRYVNSTSISNLGEDISHDSADNASSNLQYQDEHKPSYKCAYCKKIYPNRTRLDIHLRTHVRI
jgi:hypothetical protein